MEKDYNTKDLSQNTLCEWWASHSERSEESLGKRGEILRCAQDDIRGTFVEMVMLFCDGSLAPQPYAGAYSTRPSAETPRCPCPEAEAEVAGGRIQISCLFLGRGYLQATGVAAVFPRCPQNFSPEWSSPMGTALSVVIPAYNEARRLPPYLASVRRYLDKRYPDGYEVIVVDDGSGDGL